MGHKIQQTTKSTAAYGWGDTPSWGVKQEKKEEIVIPFRAKDSDSSNPVVTNKPKVKNFYGLNIQPDMIKKISNDDGLVSMELSNGAFLNYASDEFFKQNNKDGKVYKDNQGYIVFENVEGLDYSSWDDETDRISLKNTKHTYLNTGAGNDTIKVENSTNDYICRYKRGQGKTVLIDGASDPTIHPSMKKGVLNGFNTGKIENNLFWTEDIKED